jgi:hypothetical protein
MNSHLKSVGIIFLIGPVFLASCVSPTKDTLSRSSDSSAIDTKEELSLKKDSEELAELRKNIPEEKRVANDDLRDILSTLGEVKRPPQDHRDKFEREMRKIRERQRLARQKERDAYNKDERRTREEFLKNLKSERDSFMRSKADRDEKKEFFNKQEDLRKNFFADERDKRRDFESDMRQKENDESAFYREKSTEFSHELKLYTEKYNELRRTPKPNQ